jgi:hypothetical protein
MKRAFRTGTSLLLSLLILVSGSGLVIGKMICLHSGHVIFSASEAKDCCKDENEKPAFKKQCCAISNISFTQNHFETRTTVVVKPVLTSSPALFSENNFSVRYLSAYPGKINSRPPPDLFTGSSSLSLLGVFRI